MFGILVTNEKDGAEYRRVMVRERERERERVLITSWDHLQHGKSIVLWLYDSTKMYTIEPLMSQILDTLLHAGSSRVLHCYNIDHPYSNTLLVMFTCLTVMWSGLISSAEIRYVVWNSYTIGPICIPVFLPTVTTNEMHNWEAGGVTRASLSNNHSLRGLNMAICL